MIGFRVSGNSMLEYVLPLVAFTTATVAIVLVADVPSRLSDFLGDSVSGTQQNDTLSVGRFGRIPPKYKKSMSDNIIAKGKFDNEWLDGYGVVDLTLSNGQTITLDNYPMDVAKMVETAGANGTTKMLLAQLEELTQQLLDAGEIDESQANLLKGLANQGHRMADIEFLIEDGFKNSTSYQDYIGSTVSYEGQTYSMLQLSNLIGWRGFPGSNEGNGRTETLMKYHGNVLKAEGPDIGLMNPELKKFVGLYDAAMAQGNGLSNPSVKETLFDITKRIAVLSSMSQDVPTGMDFMNKYSDKADKHPEEFSPEYLNLYHRMKGDYKGAMKSFYASHATNMDASGICKIGRGKSARRKSTDGKKRSKVRCR